VIVWGLASASGAEGGKMRTVFWIGTLYLVVVGAAEIYSGMATNSPTADTIKGLPSAGSLMGSTGTTAAMLDFASAAAIYFLVLHDGKVFS
jgi:hypothetical protein